MYGLLGYETVFENFVEPFRPPPPPTYLMYAPSPLFTKCVFFSIFLPNSLLSLLFTSLIVWKISKTDKVSHLHVQRKKIRPYKIQSVTDD